MMKDALIRNSIWILLSSFAFMMLQPDIAELNTILLIIIIESTAMGLSGVALFAYSRINFTERSDNRNIGYIFLGVHLCVGLVVVGVYIAQI